MATLVVFGFPLGAAAQERLCDTQYEDCRAPILELIRNETRAIDVAFWFMEDARYVQELIERHDAGVPVRVLVDQQANASKRMNETILNMLRDGGIPMRDRDPGAPGDILHFKMMLFHGQNVVQFSKANYSDAAFVPREPNVNYVDEAIFFTNDSNLTNSFRRRFDDLWVNMSRYRNFGNITGTPVRSYPLYAIHPSMNFVPVQDFSNRAVSRYNAESHRIDAMVFRVTDHRQANAVISAVARGVPVRVITEPDEYRNPARLWHAKHVDRMWLGGVQIKHRRHDGSMHQASVVLHGLGEVIFGSSNWTTASAEYQDEHNYFYNPSLGKPWFFQWFAAQFNNKWNDTTNYVPFQPLPPDTPTSSSPSNGASGQSSSATLTWDGGPWAHLYDIYLGTTPDPPLAATNLELGSPLPGQRESIVVNNLQPGTTYYWRIVGKTWAQLGKSGPTWSFTTSGTAPAGGNGPYGGTPAAVPGTFQAENFDEGGQLVAYYDAAAGNSGGAYRPTDVDIETTSDGGGGYNVGWTRAGEWLEYTVNVAATGTYALETRVANIGTGARFHVEVDGVNKTGPIAVPDTGGWQAWQTITTDGIPLAAGERVIRVVFESVSSRGAVGNYNWFRFVQSTSSSTGNRPYLGTPAPVPGTLQAENFDTGGQDVAYHDTSAGNSGGAYRSTNVDIEAAVDAGGGFNVGWTKAEEWLNYTVNVAATGTYLLETRVANIGTGARFHVEVDGVDRTGPIAVPDTGEWQRWQTITTGGISLTAGERVIRIVLDRISSRGAAGNYNWFRFVQSASSSAGNTPFGGTPVPLAGVVQAENFDDGGQGIAYYDSRTGNSGGAYRSTDVDIAIDAATDDHYVAWTRVDEWMKYTVNVTETRDYTVNVRVANLGSGATFRFEVDGLDMTGPVAVPNTGGWESWQTIPVPLQAPLDEGQHIVRQYMITRNAENSGVGNYDYFSFQ